MNENEMEANNNFANVNLSSQGCYNTADKCKSADLVSVPRQTRLLSGPRLCGHVKDSRRKYHTRQCFNELRVFSCISERVPVIMVNVDKGGSTF
jgi:hypothetical protein